MSTNAISLSVVVPCFNEAATLQACIETVLELRDHGNDLIMLDELAAPFSRHVCEHIRTNPKQATSPSSRFLDACKAHNAGKVSKEELLGVTTRIGFNNVIDAFHVVNQDEIAKRFFLDERRENNAIRLTEEMYRAAKNLDFETAASMRDRIEEMQLEHELRGPESVNRERQRAARRRGRGGKA